ncbi:NAD-dependent epimerase/dehydratase family protein [Cohnella pontilimi]|uniref:NAD-dependent epimerase/dehydratase family protein n=1 Tax=Cohnella pontilimi TaxID=2564100 RepID=A0A4U0FGX7_9BACL|nr:NAD-dependent epimerase/dehydratase family protein [Cohnella pontilimi]TJY44263.1 NAD-dependent epimerase/dehydratase family protein [Cohnella pontilimi]
MKVLITGGAGFIGSHLAEAMSAIGAEVHILDNLSTGTADRIPAKAVFHQGDIANSSDVTRVMALRPDFVFHLAAQTDVRRSLLDPVSDADINIIGTINVLQASRQSGVKKIIFSSSCAVYGDTGSNTIDEGSAAKPISFYGISKLASEHYIQAFHDLYGLPYTILRYANVYGPGQKTNGEAGVVSVFLQRIKNHLPLIIYGNGEQTRDFLYVEDVVKANLLSLFKGNNQIIQLGTSVRTSIEQLAGCLQELHGDEVRILHEAEKPGEIRHSCLDYTYARSSLGWEPSCPIRSGLKMTYDDVMGD